MLPVLFWRMINLQDVQKKNRVTMSLVSSHFLQFHTTEMITNNINLRRRKTSLSLIDNFGCKGSNNRSKINTIPSIKEVWLFMGLKICRQVTRILDLPWQRLMDSSDYSLVCTKRKSAPKILRIRASWREGLP